MFINQGIDFKIIEYIDLSHALAFIHPLSDFSIKQPVTTVAIVIVLMCLGLLALKNLRVNQIPDVDQPVMVVNFPYPGASPETVEREIVNRVEKALQSIPQVYEIRSTSS